MSSVRYSPPFFVGIDLGGTNIKGGVVDNEGRPMSSVSIETQAEKGPRTGLDNLVAAGNLAIKASGLSWDRIAAVGLGSPGTMDLQKGLLLDPPNLPGWDNLPIRQLLADRLQKPVAFQNDANAASYAEYWVGAAKDDRSLVMFTLGTGIGCGIVVDGMIIEGRHSHGAECGHIIIEMENGRQCSCGAFGHLEGYASATALVKRAFEALDSETNQVAAWNKHNGYDDPVIVQYLHYMNQLSCTATWATPTRRTSRCSRCSRSGSRAAPTCPGSRW